MTMQTFSPTFIVSVETRLIQVCLFKLHVIIFGINCESTFKKSFKRLPGRMF